jgi:hypothetical protein
MRWMSAIAAIRTAASAASKPSLSRIASAVATSARPSAIAASTKNWRSSIGAGRRSRKS